MKTEESYISIRTSWRPPPPTASKKHVAEERVDRESNIKRRKVMNNKVSLQNVQRVEDKVFTGRVMKETELLIDDRDWEEVIKSHREKLEKETLEREKRIEKVEIKERSWALYKECKEFLERNEKNWEKQD